MRREILTVELLGFYRPYGPKENSPGQNKRRPGFKRIKIPSPERAKQGGLRFLKDGYIALAKRRQDGLTARQNQREFQS